MQRLYSTLCLISLCLPAVGQDDHQQEVRRIAIAQDEYQAQVRRISEHFCNSTNDLLAIVTGDDGTVSVVLLDKDRESHAPIWDAKSPPPLSLVDAIEMGRTHLAARDASARDARLSSISMSSLDLSSSKSVWYYTLNFDEPPTDGDQSDHRSWTVRLLMDGSEIEATPYKAE